MLADIQSIFDDSDNSRHNMTIMQEEIDNLGAPSVVGGAFIMPICQSTGRILLVKRSSDAGFEPNKWFFFGGHMDKGETPAKTAIRETYEEGNVSPNAYKLHNYPIFIDSGYDKRGKLHTVYIFPAILSEEITPKLNKEHDEYEWVEINSIKQRPTFISLTNLLNDSDANARYYTLTQR